MSEEAATWRGGFPVPDSWNSQATITCPGSEIKMRFSRRLRDLSRVWTRSLESTAFLQLFCTLSWGIVRAMLPTHTACSCWLRYGGSEGKKSRSHRGAHARFSMDRRALSARLAPFATVPATSVYIQPSVSIQENVKCLRDRSKKQPLRSRGTSPGKLVPAKLLSPTP